MAYIASNIKDMNRKIVYDLFLKYNELSKAEISRKTGISAPTVLKIVDYLTKIGCVKSVGEGESYIGRKPNILRFDPTAGYAIGASFSGVDCKIGIADFAGNMCSMREFQTDPDFKKVMNDDFPEKADRLIVESGIPRERIKGICIGVPGVVNSKDLTIELAPLIGVFKKECYKRQAQKIEDALNIPVVFENDANVAAVGEFSARKYSNDDDMIFITIGKGLGSGIILNSKLRKGRNCFAGELGYMVFGKNYKRQEKDAGWLEMEMKLDELRNEEEINADHLESLSRNLAMAIVNICVPLEIDHVVLGKFKSESYYTLLIDKINSFLRDYSFMEIKCEKSICEEPAVLGAAYLVIESVIDEMFGF